MITITEEEYLTVVEGVETQYVLAHRKMRELHDRVKTQEELLKLKDADIDNYIKAIAAAEKTMIQLQQRYDNLESAHAKLKQRVHGLTYGRKANKKA
jgi:hypothetical protein